MPDTEPKTRKAYRQAQKHAASTAEARDRKRQQVEREYAAEQHRAKRAQPASGRFDEVTYKKVNSLKKKLNWAIGIVIGLLIIVALVLFLV